jgi:D-inositol-3-phosphate glycosyltransferase
MRMADMKVAVFDTIGGYGGLHYFTDGMARGLRYAGIDVIVFTTAETPIRGDEPYRVSAVFRGLYGTTPKWQRGMHFLRGIVAAACLARRHGCNVAHMHCTSYGYVEQLTAMAARLTGMKVVVTFHDVESFGNNGSSSGYRRLLRLVSGVVLLNCFCRDEFLRVAGTKAAQVKYFVVPAGNFFDRFPSPPERTSARRLLGLPDDKTIYLFFGNSRREKGLDLLLRAMRKLRSRKDVMLVVAGKMKPEQESFYRGIADETGCGAQIHFDVGLISDDMAVAYYAAADLIVVPYRRIYDSGVTLMAMSLGRAVLASNLPPLVDLLGNGRGLFFSNENETDLAEKLLWAAKHRGELDAYGRTSKDYVLENRNWNDIGSRLAEVYRRILDSTV